MRIPQIFTLILFLTGVGQQGKSVEGCAWRKEGTDKKRIRWKSFDNHLIHQSGRRDSNPRPSAWKANALSTELLPQSQWARMDSNHRRHKPADLQSAPFGHSGTCPLHCCNVCFKKRAEDGTQTRDPQLGRLMLYRLSYFRKVVGKDGFEPPKA